MTIQMFEGGMLMADMNNVTKLTGQSANAGVSGAKPVNNATGATSEPPASETVNQPTATVQSSAVELSDERKKKIEAIADKYFEKIKKPDTSGTNVSLLNDLLKIMKLLEKVCDEPDFVSAYFSEVGTFIDRSTTLYDQQIDFYFHSPLIKLFIEEENKSVKQVLLYFKEVLSAKAIQAQKDLDTNDFDGLFLLIQLSCFSLEPMKEFTAGFQGLSVTTDLVIDLYWLYNSNEPFQTLLSRFNRYIRQFSKNS